MAEPKPTRVTFWTWPFLLAGLVPALGSMYNPFPIRTFAALSFAVVGAGILLSAYPGIARHSSSADLGPADRTDALNSAIVGPFALLGVLILALGIAVYFLPEGAFATHAIELIFAVLFLGVFGLTIARAWRATVLYSKQE